jgi:methylmalonyl-CoA mutase N-terminal domain/subunit
LTNFGQEKLDEIKVRQKEWEDKTLNPLLEKYPERLTEFVTTSSSQVNRLYTPLDLVDSDYPTDIGFPGEFPYTRGVQASMFRGRLWTMRQYAGFGTAEETNKRFKLLLEQGQTGLSVAFDLPTQIGYDSDHPLALGEVGKVGVAIDTLKDMETLFDGIPLDKVSTSMTINAPASVLLAMYIVVAEKQSISQDKLAGTIQNDILKEYSARGTYIFPPRPSMRLITDVFEYCSKWNKMPRWNTISISGYHMREAGCTAVQEVAFTLANAISYVEAALKKGIELDTFARRLSFFWCSHNDFFEEIAKFRAARRLWARIMRERFEAKNPRSWQMRFHTQTAGQSLTAQQPENNIVRVAIQALSAACGGTQSLHTNSMDEALALPSEKAAQIALKTQQLIAYESGVALTIDPLAGSYYVETMTNEIEKHAMEYIKKIDEMGGAIVAVERGFIQREIHESAYRYQKEIESKRRIIVGVNEFTIGEQPDIEILRVDPEIEKVQLARLAGIKNERDSLKVQETLKRIEKIANSDENLMPAIVDAVKAYATLGEICDILRGVFGEYTAPDVF